MKSLIILSLLALAPLHAAEKNPEPVVTVGGQVRSPGPVMYRKKLTVYTAILAARGATEFGAMKRVKVIREGKTTVYDMTDDKQKSVEVKPDDVVEVPQKNFIGR